MILSPNLRILGAFACGVAVMLGVSCSMSAGERERLLAESQALQQRSTDERQRQQQVLAESQQAVQAALAAAQAATQAGDQARASAERARAEDARNRAERASKALSLLDRLDPLLAQGHEVLSVGTNPDGTWNIQPAAVALGGAVGGPLGAGITVGLPLLASLVSGFGWFRKAQEAKTNLAAGQEIVNRLDSAFASNPEFNAAGDKVWPKIEAGMSEKAKALVGTMTT